jgi:hypothetical protein
MPRPPAARRRRLGGILLDGPRLGDAEAGAAAAIGGPHFAAWTGGLLSAATTLLTCWFLPGIWCYDARSPADPALICVR